MTTEGTPSQHFNAKRGSGCSSFPPLDSRSTWNPSRTKKLLTGAHRLGLNEEWRINIDCGITRVRETTRNTVSSELAGSYDNLVNRANQIALGSLKLRRDMYDSGSEGAIRYKLNHLSTDLRVDSSVDDSKRRVHPGMPNQNVLCHCLGSTRCQPGHSSEIVGPGGSCLACVSHN